MKAVTLVNTGLEEVAKEEIKELTKVDAEVFEGPRLGSKPP